MQEEQKLDVAKEMKANLGKPTAILFCFDCTGSMRPAIEQVRQKLRDLVEMMTADIPGLKVGLIAHGDYCDGDNCIKTLDLTDDLEKIMTFINTAPNTGGGDAPECYELALQTAKGMSWPKEGGSVVLIGDDEPHEVGYITSSYGEQQTTNNISWRDEVRQLLDKNVKVFPMQCLFNAGRNNVNKFWEEVSGISGTPLLMLESFTDSANMLEAVAYASAGAAAYDGYKMKFCAEVASGDRSIASENLCSNQAKLDDFAKNVK